MGRLVWEEEGCNLEGELLDLEDLVKLGPTTHVRPILSPKVVRSGNRQKCRALQAREF